MDKKEVVDYIKEQIIYGGLELSELGHKLEDITDDTALISEDGLSLDSIDVLDIFVGIQRKYNLELGEITKEMMDEYCRTPLTLADLVIDKLASTQICA